jgi:hypothetical protein
MIALPWLFDMSMSIQQRLLGVVVAQLLVALWVHFVVQQAASGWRRLVIATPALLALIAMPCPFSWQRPDILIRVSLIFTNTWLGTFKACRLITSHPQCATCHASH